MRVSSVGGWLGCDLEHVYVYEDEESDELWTDYIELLKTYAEQEFYRIRAPFWDISLCVGPRWGSPGIIAPFLSLYLRVPSDD